MAILGLDVLDRTVQFTLLVRGIYYEGYRPTEQPETYRTFEGWADEIRANYGSDAPSGAELDPERLTRAVFAVINQQVDRGLAEKMRSALPEDVRTLWPNHPESAAQV